MQRIRPAFLWAASAALLLASSVAVSQVPVKDDPLVRMPGSQPAPEGNVTLESPNRCLNCHAGYNPAVEPGFNWQGSMMAHAARDFLFFSCLTVAAQDSMWAVGRPVATDICLRCHSPMGWLEGRSDPTNGSALTGADFDGVQCDFCHRMFDPFHGETHDGSREGADWAGYWDESGASDTPSQPAADLTLAEDAAEASAIRMFRGDGFFVGDRPRDPAYQEAGSGQYFVSSTSEKRASFSDAAARHQMLYSRFHKSKYFCSSCHDVSNPVLANLGFADVPPGDGQTKLPTEVASASSFYHVERTFSEFMLSDFGQPGGAEGRVAFAPDTFATSLPGNRIGRCQDCHMRDVVGAGANKNGAPVRPGDSVEHPRSGQPLHDLTGGNVWVSWVLASAVAGSPNHDPLNETLLSQGPSVLTLDLTAGQGIDPVALLAGVDRARQQLEMAATIEAASYDPLTGALSFRISNHTGHKLISGFPEGRRMFVNVKAWSGATLLWEVNPYDAAAGTLEGLSYPYQPGFGLPAPQPIDPAAEQYVDALVYEMHPSSLDLTGESETFHFALATDRYKDNRIPPRGFRIAEAAARLAQPRDHGADAPDYYTAAEYAGGWDDVSLDLPPGADRVEVRLYYQTTSREYVEFLRDEINANPANLTLPADAYVVQTDPFFAQLRAWGDTLWELWSHNMNVPGAAPVLMAEAIVGEPGGGCEAPVPTLLEAHPDHHEVTVVWSDEHTADPAVIGYAVYYDQAGKLQPVTSTGLVTSYVDTGLTNGEQYCYAVASLTADCESPTGDVVCATPSTADGESAVGTLETGRYEGKGKSATFVTTVAFTVGDEVVVRAWVTDAATGAPLVNAVVEMTVSGPETVRLVSAPSDSEGVAEASWKTAAPNRKGQGGTAPGDYAVSVDGVVLDGFPWDGVAIAAAFTLG